MEFRGLGFKVLGVGDGVGGVRGLRVSFKG